MGQNSQEPLPETTQHSGVKRDHNQMNSPVVATTAPKKKTLKK